MATNITALTRKGRVASNGEIVEAVVALLKHLGIRHVSVGTHSGGTVYALDLLLHHPEILHPDRPYIGIGAPWICPDRSGCRLMAITQSLPRAMIEQTDKLASLVSTFAVPITSAGSGLADIVCSFATAPPVDPEVAFEEVLRPRNMKFVYSGAVHGLSQDAVLLMRRGGSQSGWSDWGDYDELIPRLAEKLRAENQRLKVELFLGQTDFMIGNPCSKGPEWFKTCWEEATQQDNSSIEFSSKVVGGADHDTVWSLKWGAAQQVFGDIGSCTCSVDASGDMCLSRPKPLRPLSV
ncbi:hypothetical protein E4U43_002060 [Claviceps pusilla]|uniref:AB hydrolase-1 domain-containing protein n=1 Tax=Claviceps pusilla TaxID=123648 RepID=A0A9P7SYM9_9HYPO|nr:hypothetical protein E4U43_002060 [Claviceps pusilla]